MRGELHGADRARVDRAQSTTARHLLVDQRYVGLGRLGQRDRLIAVPSHTDDVELARDVLGLGDVSGLAQRADEEKADYPSIRVCPDYIKPQDVATTQDVAAAAPS